MSDYYIPGELHREILALLSVQHVLPLRLVCKDWKSIIDDLVVPAKFFIRSRTGKLYTLPLQSLSFDDDSSASEETPEEKLVDATDIKNIVGSCANRVREFPLPSCNNLILITSKTREWVIWDTFYDTVCYIPPYDGFAPTEKETMFKTAFQGIGYDSLTCDYKVVRIASIFGARKSDKYLFKTLIYSLKSGIWHRIDGFPYKKGNPSRCPVRGVFMKGALHWTMHNAKVIVSLNLSSETYHRLPFPSFPSSIEHPGYEPSYEYLDAQGEHLFFSCDQPSGKRVWILEDYGGVNKWTLLISFPPKEMSDWYMNPMRIVAYIKSKEQLIIHYDGDKLMLFDVETKECLNKVTVKGFEDGGFSCQQLDLSHAWRHGNIFGADESIDFNRSTESKRKRKTSDVMLEISVCKRPKHWFEE